MATESAASSGRRGRHCLWVSTEGFCRQALQPPAGSALYPLPHKAGAGLSGDHLAPTQVAQQTLKMRTFGFGVWVFGEEITKKDSLSAIDTDYTHTHSHTHTNSPLVRCP